MELVVGLADVGRDDVALAGGKGANLGELVRAGLPVPPGFVATTEAYRVFVEVGAVPDDLRAALLTAYAALGRPPVAVRSSGTAEDLAGASFAGQQDTYLNVRGDDAVVDAVRRCWGSLWSDRAVSYRAHQGIEPGTVAVAVVVQEMVDTDQLVVRAPDGPVLARTTAHKAVLTGYVADGTAERDVPAGLRDAAVLDDAAAVGLTRLGASVATHFGAPQDIEWVRRDGAFFLVQSRPITVLPPPEADPPTGWSVPEPRSLHVRASIVEQLPDPLTPLFADLVRTSVSRSLQALLRELVGADVVREGDVDLPTVNGYAYYRYAVGGFVRLTLRSGKAFRMLLSPGEQVLRPAGPGPGRSAGGHVPAGVRQPADPGREVAVGPRRLVAGTPGPRRGAAVDAGRRAGRRVDGRARRPRGVAATVPTRTRGSGAWRTGASSRRSMPSSASVPRGLGVPSAAAVGATDRPGPRGRARRRRAGLARAAPRAARARTPAAHQPVEPGRRVRAPGGRARRAGSGA